MLDVLLASGAPRSVRPSWASASLLTHGLIIALAVVATKGALDRPRVTTTDQTILLFVPKPPPPPPDAPRPPEPANLVITEPPPKGFQTIEMPKEIPNVIPPIDLNQRPLDPRDFTGRGVEGGIADGVVGGTGPVDRELPDEAGAIYQATLADSRFNPAVLVSEPTPRYPRHLEQLGVPGRVVVEFVIDTVGRVEPASIRVLESTHEAFEEAARKTVAAAVFRPARLRSQPVRQLTRQAVRFIVQ